MSLQPEVMQILKDLGIEQAMTKDLLNLCDWVDHKTETDAACEDHSVGKIDERVVLASVEALRILTEKVGQVFDWRVRERFDELPAGTRAMIRTSLEAVEAHKKACA